MKVKESAKWETVRRLRYGALVRLFRHRWGHILPDDDAGRGDLWELVTNVSLAPAAPDKKIRHAIELWAPWMQADEAEAMVEHVKMLTPYERTPTGEQLGQRLRVTNAERQLLKLWPFKPIDATDEEIAAQRRQRRNEKRRLKRGRTRAEYLASCLTATKPWQCDGISRSQWYRRHATSRGRDNSYLGESILVASSAVEAQKGQHGGAEVVSLSERTKAEGSERTASGSLSLCPHLSHEREQKAAIYANLARKISSTNPRMSWALLACFVWLCAPDEERGAA